MTEHTGASYSFMGFEPHGHCFLWQPNLIALHAISDFITGLSYYFIPFLIIYFLKKRKDLPFQSIFVLSALFIIACGTTHIMSVVTVWYAEYWLEGYIKLATAIVSLATAVVLVPLMPKLIAIPSPAQLATVIGELEKEIATRRAAERELQTHKDQLETLVAQRTAALQESNLHLEMEIHERRQIEQELRDSEQRFRATFEQAAVGLGHMGLDGRWLKVNEKFCDIVGYSREELLQRRFQDITYPDDMESSLHQFKRLLAGDGSNYFLETRYLHKNGSTVWTLLTVSLVRGEKSSPQYCIVAVQDITARKLTESSLEKAQNYITNILDSMPSVLVGVDPQGVVTHWNMAAETSMGITAKQAEGHLLEEVFPRLSTHLDDIRAAVLERKPRSTEREMFKENDEQHYQDVMIYPLVSNGVEGAVVRVDDVTQRVHIEEMMVQSEKMMSVGGLAAGMAHEINNPLSAIMQGAQVVLTHLSLDMPANIAVAAQCGCTMQAIRAYAESRKILKFLEGIREAGGRAARIVSNMLEFSRKSESRRSVTDINLILDKSVELALSDYDLKKKYDFKQIRIERDYTPELPEVPCTRTEIEQVILNLLKNAAQAMSKQTDRIEPPTIILRTSIGMENKSIHIDVEDNGPGMAENVRKRVFEPFFTTKEVGEGTGLGLSVSYFIIVTNHRGRIDVQSELGKGTRFTITLPLE